MDPKTPMNTLLLRAVRPAVAACAVAIAIAGVGCEERVVSVNQSPMTGLSTNTAYEYRAVSSLSVDRGERRAEEDEGFLEEVGEFMFGWMDGEDEADAGRGSMQRDFTPIWRREQQGQIRMPDQTAPSPLGSP